MVFGSITFDHYNQKQHMPIDLSFPTFSKMINVNNNTSRIPSFLRDMISYPLLIQSKNVDLSSASNTKPIIVQYHNVLRSVAMEHAMEDFKCYMEVKAFTTDGMPLPITNTTKEKHVFTQHYHNGRLSPNTLELPFLYNNKIDQFWLYMKPIKMFYGTKEIPIKNILGTMLAHIIITKKPVVQSNIENVDFFKTDGRYGFLSNLWDGTKMTKSNQVRLFGEYRPFKLLIHNETWKSAEHYLQAMQFRLPDIIETDTKETIIKWQRHEEYIAYMKLASTIPKVTKMGNICKNNTVTCRDSKLTSTNDTNPSINSIMEKFAPYLTRITDWDTKRDDILMNCLVWKFTNNPVLLRQLIQTGDKKIRFIHTNMKDMYLGTNGKTGENKLGRILMVVRDMLRDDT
jgi:predicted NAD-dependent protein-ADP-ribosyltransferase YbiA (DUF1768 family)